MRDKGALSYGAVQAGFVHHTVNANAYSRDQVPALIRGIYAYHTRRRDGAISVTTSSSTDSGASGEGRYGGLERPVVGARLDRDGPDCCNGRPDR